MICYLYPEPTFLLFTSEAPELLYYSHIPVAIASLLLGSLVYASNTKSLSNRLFFSICLSFFCWTLANLVLWTNIHVDILLFVWPMLAIFSTLISLFSVYFVYAYVEQKDLSIRKKILLFSLGLPIFFFAASHLNVNGFNLQDCDAFGYEGQIYKAYQTFVVAVSILWIIYLLFIKFRSKILQERKRSEYLLLGSGICLFLITFFSSVYIASYLVDYGYVNDSRYEFFGLFGMIIFLSFISYNVVTFKAFNMSLISSQILVVCLTLLTASQLTFNTDKISTILTFITIALTISIGYFLIRSVRREVKQREQIEQLAVGLERANARLQELDKQKSEFVSIASHQLRSPLTAIRGYAAMLKDGSYGTMPEKASEPLDRIHESAKLMASSIEDFLSVSRIESGNMKYELADFNLREQAEHIVDDLRAEALKVGLVLLYKSDLTSQGFVNADIGKTQQILHNLINNSLKYTQKGTVTVFVHEDLKLKKLYVEIIDTGIGMSKETIDTLFAKFTRAKNANSVNIKGTGLGLFVAREMARAMNGEITAHSEGDGLGSHFILTFPLVR